MSFKSLKATVLMGAALFAAGSANAAVYNYSGVVTLCTGTCDSFAALAVGSTLNGTFDIDTTPGGSFGDADVNGFQVLVFNPGLPPSPPVGDPVNDNPLVLDSSLGIAASNGSLGSTDAMNNLDGGELLLEFLIPPFSSNGAFVVFDLSTGNGQVCLFYSTAGCIPGATQALVFEGEFSIVPIPGAVWLFGSAMLGFLGLRKRG